MLSYFLTILAAETATPPSVPAGSGNTILVISLVIGALFSGGGLSLFLTVRRQNKKTDAESRKLRVEADVLPIDLAKGAVVVQSDVIKDLRTQLDSQDERIKRQHAELESAEAKHEASQVRSDDAYRRLEAKCSSLQEKFSDLLVRFDFVLTERSRLEDKNDKLEAALEECRNGKKS